MPHCVRSKTFISSAIALLLLLIAAGAFTQSPGPLSSTHEFLDDSGSCDICHGNNPSDDEASQDESCLTCHEGIAWLIAQQRGFHAEYSEGCGGCHVEHEGPDARLIDPDLVDPKGFDHNDTGWPLGETHADLSCSDCHQDQHQVSPVLNMEPGSSPDGSFLGLENRCTACHAEDEISPGLISATHAHLDCRNCHSEGASIEQACLACHQGIDHLIKAERGFHAEYSEGCAACHTEHEGRDALLIDPDFVDPGAFDHSDTGWEFQGRHSELECTACHRDNFRRSPVMKLRPTVEAGETFLGLETTCVNCHINPHGDRFNTPLDKKDCTICHSFTAFRPARIDAMLHATFPFPLVGAHQALPCFDCHTELRLPRLATTLHNESDPPPSLLFAKTHASCSDCHEDQHGGRFSSDCSQCHGADRFHPVARFDHAEATGFALEGAHADLECATCHSSKDLFQGDLACVSCHQDVHRGEFGTACALCHSSRGFQDPSTFARAHRETRFPLTGAHTTVACDACHGSPGGEELNYVLTPVDCEACHLAEYDATGDPDHGKAGFPHDCSECHTPSEWASAVFDHSFFDLSGGHAAPTCAQCHSAGIYEGMPDECYACHQADYEGTSDPDHAAAGFPTHCTICHDPTRWDNGAFDHSFFDLSGGHAAASCAQCHGGGLYEGTPTECYTCHEADYEETSDPDHAAAGFSTDCTHCHDLSRWDNGAFDHSFFDLSGGHASPTCAECHLNGVYEGISNTCIACHHTDYENTEEPDHAEAGFPTDCRICHDPTNWENGEFNHAFFDLSGGHAAASCAQCHGGGVYAGTPTECYTCHETDYAEASDPDHTAAGFSTDCTHCHDLSGWDNGVFDHSFFALSEAHAFPSCSQCHIGGVYAGTSSDCAACHLSDYEGTTEPDHAEAGFPTDCLICHDPTNWENGEFNHAFFDLSGGHTNARCVQCHINGVYEGTPDECISCHQADYAETSNPDHAAAGFSTTCTQCHNLTGWDNGAFDHSFFDLSGGHAAADCAACHGGGVYAGTPDDCASCHQEDYEATDDPDHAAAGFPTDCTLCHDLSGWENGSFDHSFFDLSGGHAATTCLQCHAGGVFEGTADECFSCHHRDYEDSIDPNHRAAHFAIDCTQCHDLSGWENGVYDHSFFDLSGPHAVPTCVQCHLGGIYEGMSSECMACHLNDYTAAINPDHSAAGFPYDCTICHTLTSWEDGLFDHSFFDLSGGHAAAACSQCHSGGVYDGTPDDCYSCHQDDYDHTIEPAHGAAGFSTICTQCHNLSGWENGYFNHSFFSLSGGHAAATCSQCHIADIYEGLPDECYACHRDDYEAASDPDHEAANFSTDCTQCHGLIGWENGQFDHSFFDLSGGHTAATCSQCHVGGLYEGTPHDCFSCHQEDYEGTVSPGHISEGFPIDCTICHDLSAWENGTFDHSFFDLSGGHATALCAACHVGGVYAGTPSECYGCHQEDYAGATDPDHTAAEFTTDCTQCHDLSGWENGAFDHSFFPLSEAHAISSCSQCHTGGVYEGTSDVCYACHESEYEGADDPDHSAAGFPTDCALCHEITDWHDGEFNHTFFDLSGGHAAVDCSQCHIGGVYEGTSDVCYACHESEYEGADDPDHSAAGFPTDCALCHEITDWNDGEFNHTFFDLSGGHAGVNCSQCHTGGVYEGTSDACYACHESDYEGADDPDHSAAGFPTDCTLCHDLSGWENSNFDHSFFDLWGGHAEVDCSQCHIGGVYEGTSSECYDCHFDDYNMADDPNHLGTAFPTDCTFCHDLSGWGEGEFTHWPPYFPITSGPHSDEWDQCTECHTNPQNFGEFDCLACHPHSNQNQMDGRHHWVPDYEYDSDACYACHPDGEVHK